jgi:hypothetical protein
MTTDAIGLAVAAVLGLALLSAVRVGVAEGNASTEVHERRTTDNAQIA